MVARKQVVRRQVDDESTFPLREGARLLGISRGLLVFEEPIIELDMRPIEAMPVMRRCTVYIRWDDDPVPASWQYAGIIEPHRIGRQRIVWVMGLSS